MKKFKTSDILVLVVGLLCVFVFFNFFDSKTTLLDAYHRMMNTEETATFSPISDEKHRAKAMSLVSEIQGLLTQENLLEAQKQELRALTQESLNAAQSAINADTSDPLNWATLGSVYSTLALGGDVDAKNEALQAFSEAQKLAPANSKYLLLEAYLFLNTGEIRIAREIAAEALELNPEDPYVTEFMSYVDTYSQ